MRVIQLFRHPIIGNTTWLMGGKIFRYAIGAVVTFVVARHLGPKDYGILSYIVAIVALVQPFATLGLSALLTRQLITKPAVASRILGTSFWIRTLANVFCLSLVVLFIAYSKSDEKLLVTGVILLSFGRSLGGFEVIDFYFQSKTEAKFSVWAQSTAFLIISVIRIGLVVLHCKLFTFLVAQSLELVLEAIFWIWVYRYRSNRIEFWRFDWKLASELLKKSWPLALAGIAAVITLKIDQVMIGDMLGYQDVGIYSAASRLSEVWLFVPTAIVASTFPGLLITWQNDRVKYIDQMHRLFSLLAYLGITVAILIQIFANPIIRILYGPGFHTAAPVLVIHIWGAVFIFMRTLVSKWLVTEELYIFSLVTHSLGAVTNVTLNLWMIPRYGILGAAWATVASYAISSYLALWIHPRTREIAILMTRAVFAPKLHNFMP